MATKTINVDIDPKGNTKVDVEGYTDGSCRQATEALEEALGKVTSRKGKTGGSCNVEERVRAGRGGK